MMTHDGRTTITRMFLWTMLLLVWSGSITVQGKVTSLVPHQKTQPSWKTNLELTRTNHKNHHDGHNLRRSNNNVRRMQHDKDLDEVDYVDPDAITNPPSVSLKPSVTPSERPTATPSAIPTSSPSASPSAGPTRSPSAAPSQSPSARPSLSFSPSIETSETPSMSLSPSISPTGTPSMSPSIDCTSDETGSFGVTNITNDRNETTSLTVTYYYEVETSTTTVDNDDPQEVVQTVILPAIERAISDRIIALFFNDRAGECAARLDNDINNLRKRQLQMQMQMQQQERRRKLEVVGVSGSPPDVIYEGSECQIGGQDLLGPSTDNTTTNNSSTNIFQMIPDACSVVEGELTLFVKTTNVKGDEEERVKTLIREGMEEGDFVSAHPNIYKLHYIDNFEDQYVKAEDDNEGGFLQDLVDQFGVIPLAIVAAAIAMVCFLCLVLCLCLRKRKNEDDDCDNDESMSSSSATDHPSSIVTTTTSSSLKNVTPLPQSTSTSLDIHKDEADGYGSA
eukprot:scaffold42615_cov55-Attheya_sp.AAC.3